MKKKLNLHTSIATSRAFSSGEEGGVSLLVTLIALAVFSALGGVMFLSSVTEVRMSDNYESRLKARQAALAGIGHARELLRGVDFSNLLLGPDGTYNNNPSHLALARMVPFRNPLSWDQARSTDIVDPTSTVIAFADDGIINTGKAGSIDGTVLIPMTGIAQTSTNPYGSGTLTDSRYFVKVSDNNGEVSELVADSADNPFLDGDKTIIVRSMGISRTIAENSGGMLRANSVAVYEARFHRTSTFDIDAPMVVEGDQVLPSNNSMFNGNSFDLDGGTSNFGIATIDTDLGSGVPMPDQITSELSPNQEDNIQGQGGQPSVGDITGSLNTPEKQDLLDPDYLYNFVTKDLLGIADTIYSGDQHWSGGSAPYFGTYDVTLPAYHPNQEPMLTYINGDLTISGNLHGGGLLVVRGKLSGGGSLIFNGLILLLGQGEMDLSGMNLGVYGGIFIANLDDSARPITFGIPKITLSGNSNIYVHSDALKVARELMPSTQLGLREITTRLDP